MRPVLVLLAVIVAWLITSDAALERPPAPYLAVVAVRVPAVPASDVTASADPDACDQLARPMLLRIGPGLEPRWQWDYSDGALPPPQAPACAQQGRVVAP